MAVDSGAHEDIPLISSSNGLNSNFDLLIRNSFDILVLLDINGHQKYVSDSCYRILGYTPEELINIDVIDVMIHPEDQEKTRQGLENIIKCHNYGGTQYRHRHKDGSWVFLEAYGTNQLENPDIQAIVLNVRDITDRKLYEQRLLEKEQQLKDLNATKDRFISIIGHDLKNPFTSIIGLSELIQTSVENEDLAEISEFANLIHESSKLVNDLLTNLLAWSKSQSGGITFNPQKSDITALILEVIDLFRELASQKTIQLKVECNESIFLRIDRDMIHSVFRNLISNSIKFTHIGGTVLINVQSHKDEHHFIISDNGTGLSDRIKSSLFRIDDNQSMRGTIGEPGTGLGLILCKEFIEQHNGNIWVESILGKGTDIHFTIPHSENIPNNGSYTY